MGHEKLKLVPYQAKAYSYKTFKCGNSDLDEWLQTSAGQNQKRNRARTFLLVSDIPEVREVYGYFSLVNYQLAPLDATAVQGKSAKYPMPATMLARLAVATNTQGQGLGERLITLAMLRTLEASERSASEVLVVDAIDDSAIRFYEHYDFELLHDDGRRLFLLTKKIEKALAGFTHKG